MYAVLKTGGKQYTIRENEVINVEKLDAPVGESIDLDGVLMVSGDNGVVVGTPTVPGAKVTGKILAHGLNKKIVGFTYKKKNEQRRYGHRQPYTQVLIEKIQTG